MARFSKIQVLSTLNEQALVPLFYHSEIEVCKQVLSACYAGGARVLEFTNRGDFAHEVFADLSAFCEAELPQMILGIGSVVDAGTASLYMQLGANFVVSASLREDIAKVCNRRKIPYLPGCGSLSEIGQAEEWGCDIVKLFPGSVYGPQFVKAIKGPQPWTQIMVTGGVAATHENLKSWFDAGVFAVGMGSALVPKDFLIKGDFKALQENIRQSLALIQILKSQSK